MCPFIVENENILRYHLIDGRREDLIPNTPTKYLKLYQSCRIKTSSFYWIGRDDKYSRIVYRQGNDLLFFYNNENVNNLKLIKLVLHTKFKSSIHF